MENENIKIKADQIYTINFTGIELVKVMNLLEEKLEPFNEIKSLADTIIAQVATPTLNKKEKK
jgi:hypothetical protein